MHGKSREKDRRVLTAVNISDHINPATIEADEAEGEKHTHGQTSMIGRASIFGYHRCLQAY
jgi:hypothetical protein